MGEHVVVGGGAETGMRECKLVDIAGEQEVAEHFVQTIGKRRGQKCPNWPW